MNQVLAAQRIVQEILNSRFYRAFKRFDITYPNFRVYGRVTTHNGRQVVMIQNIRFADKFQQRGLFSALVAELKNEFRCPVYLQCVQNREWEAALRRSPEWRQVADHDYLSM